MKKILLLLAFPVIFSSAFGQNNYWQQRVEYRITVTLDDATNTLAGFESLTYFNNSPDTLHFIWFHLWPNAYKNDRTAFSDQLLGNGQTNFYFENEAERGYIDRLAFAVDKQLAETVADARNPDIIKLLLPKPLAPGAAAKIETPFHEKLPFDISRGGFAGQSYAATQWFPKPAVYDATGWHPIPYLDQGEFYSEYGSFDVQISLPENYVVAATGRLQTTSEQEWLKARANVVPEKSTASAKVAEAVPASSKTIKTIRFVQDSVHDFAWFADKRFLLKTDTVRLSSGRVIRLQAFVLPANQTLWANAITDMKRAIRTRSEWVGEYPYSVVSVVDNAAPVGGGMEYPTVTLLSAKTAAGLEAVINHEIGHNWFYGILGSNERRYPWMDEGINTYYDKRYKAVYPSAVKDPFAHNAFLYKRIPAEPDSMLLAAQEIKKLDQPINTSSEDFSVDNYGLVAYEKSGEWMQLLERELGKETFDATMHAYFNKWKFRHPQPADFKAVADSVAGKDLVSIFALQDKKGALQPAQPRKLKAVSFFDFKETTRYKYLSFAPAVGVNYYDKLMVGVAIHNYNVPPSPLQFVAVPVYATGTKTLNGIGHISYDRYPGSKGAKITFSSGLEKFTDNVFVDSDAVKHPLSFSKISPAIKYVFAPANPRSTVTRWVQWKTFFIQEKGLLFSSDSNGNEKIDYPQSNRYLNQLQAVIRDERALYPYSATLTAQQGDKFARVDLTANYFFNYPKGGGLNVRFFAGKFFYLTEKNFLTSYQTDRYHLNLTGPDGYEDYTYSNYFLGRNEFDGLSSQQIAERDGFFKVRTNQLSAKVGKTDDWLSAINLSSDIPKQFNPLSVFPVRIPLRLFADVGTYSGAWKVNSGTDRFLYDAGIQISFFKNLINIYAPIVYSKVFRDYINSTIAEKKFLKTISFSINVGQLRSASLISQLNL